MNQQQFELIFEKLTTRLKEVLQRILAGETDADIAAAMEIGEPTVRKHIERICEKFGLSNENSDIRRHKRSELVTLVAKYKPDLLTECQLKFTDKIAEITDKDDNNICEFVLQLISVNQPINEEFKKFILRFNCNEQERKQIAKALNKLGYQHYLNSDLNTALSRLKLAIEFKPDFASAHYNLGVTYEKIDHWTQACEHYKIAMQYQNRAGEAAINNLARLEILRGNSVAAVEMIAPILSKVKDHTVKAALHKNLGWAYFQQTFYELAKQHLFISLELENDYPPAYCLLAQVQAALGDKENSIISWRKFLESYAQEQELKSVQWHLPELEIWKLDAMRNIMETAI
ncbi:LuxR C-terminal-related transcriptional regulator [Dolichospermum sp. ST_sed1]|nr:LuxR C-terminal-related transcriptional regulator [Dolichospermum sp. ST_sed1]MDD1427794.1 LuxR C-terminal-related transcriptional regulator [Dolichospermum sp. ST_sed9]MDD1431784.1 LuxR C-terminal-related transcriptional regulator [Dolichospermum sp. ST_sed6]MDD1437151.1 LuxR C-terminal-related transcriptional regulator [Dolichospermum sp. ST_sed10]MDD1443334.1 LuxR C-terminal-related transcriptional regulator [Dolichospermum sp. ST_sed3]MDD1448990.1 LuxR C-terminal-related transcriptional